MSHGLTKTCFKWQQICFVQQKLCTKGQFRILLHCSYSSPKLSFCDTPNPSLTPTSGAHPTCIWTSFAEMDVRMNAQHTVEPDSMIVAFMQPAPRVQGMGSGKFSPHALPTPSLSAPTISKKQYNQ